MKLSVDSYNLSEESEKRRREQEIQQKKLEKKQKDEEHMNKPLLLQWIDDYWYSYVAETATYSQIDNVVRKLFN